MKVQTEVGLIERTDLIARDLVDEQADDVRVIATEWYLAGRMVRRDVWVNVLRGHSMGSNGGG